MYMDENTFGVIFLICLSFASSVVSICCAIYYHKKNKMFVGGGYSEEECPSVLTKKWVKNK